VGSGTLMIANLSSKGGSNESDSPIWLRVFWSVVITIVSIGLLLAGSFHSMQSAVVLCGLPFSVIILLYMFGLAKALKQDALRPQPPQVIAPVTPPSHFATEKSETL